MLAAIFRASIEDLTAEDYDEDQRAAWASAAADEDAFGRRMAGLLTLVATIDGAPAAFGALKDNATIDMLYVYPAVAGQGLGTLLCDALETLAIRPWKSRWRRRRRMGVNLSATRFSKGFALGEPTKGLRPLETHCVFNAMINSKRISKAPGL
jgi:GNAT superfamily N-acetyltransferase